MLEEVKGYLKITWNDEDNTLKGIINRGKNYLNDITGADLDYDFEGQPKALLLDYCRYSYNNASEYFEENYQSQILRLQLKAAVNELSTDEVTNES